MPAMPQEAKPEQFVAGRMVDVARLLKVHICVTEQYPKGLGSTVPDLAAKLQGTDGLATTFPKVTFSMLCPEVQTWLQNQIHIAGTVQTVRKTVLLVGVEAHVCVQQTALDLLEKGYNVVLIVDGITSRKDVDRTAALQRLQAAGCVLTTSESAMFELIRTKDHESFKAISALAKEQPDYSSLTGAA